MMFELASWFEDFCCIVSLVLSLEIGRPTGLNAPPARLASAAAAANYCFGILKFAL